MKCRKKHSRFDSTPCRQPVRTLAVLNTASTQTIVYGAVFSHLDEQSSKEPDRKIRVHRSLNSTNGNVKRIHLSPSEWIQHKRFQENWTLDTFRQAWFSFVKNSEIRFSGRETWFSSTPRNVERDETNFISALKEWSEKKNFVFRRAEKAKRFVFNTKFRELAAKRHWKPV